MKNILGMLLLIAIGTSCAPKYGCPYSSTETPAPQSKNCSTISEEVTETTAMVNVVACEE